MTTQTTTLADFLLARIAEDEEVASGGHPLPDSLAVNLAREERHQRVLAATLGFRCPTCQVDAGQTCMAMTPPRYAAKPAAEMHATRLNLGRAEVHRIVGALSAWTTPRILAECAAKRLIVDWCRRWIDRQSGPETSAPEGVLIRMAQPYGDHPDFDPSWATP